MRKNNFRDFFQEWTPLIYDVVMLVWNFIHEKVMDRKIKRLRDEIRSGLTEIKMEAIENLRQSKVLQARIESLKIELSKASKPLES